MSYFARNQFLEAKASKSMHLVCIEKSPDHYLFIHPRCSKIVPLVVWVYTVGFVKYFVIAVFYFILNQSGQLWNKEKITIFSWFKCILQSFQLSLLTGLSASIFQHQNFISPGIKRITWTIFLVILFEN